jgi:hypothetical protein
MVCSRYNNGFIVKLMLMWRREEKRKMIVWLLYKRQVEHGCIDSGRTQITSVVRRNRKKNMF